LAERLYLTLVDDDADGDTFFPEYAHLAFTETARDDRAHGMLQYTFITYDRIS
jgi:dihydrofolate reductase